MKQFAAQALLLASLGGLAPAQADAQTAFAIKNAHLRAGPARSYPVVAVLMSGAEVVVQGCLANYSWCDVSAGSERGWVYAGNISYAYQGQYVPVLTHGQEIGIAIVGFVLFDYWGHYYPERPWYHDRDRWRHHPPRPPVPPAPVHPPPPPHPVPHPRPQPPDDKRIPPPPPRQQAR